MFVVGDRLLVLPITWSFILLREGGGSKNMMGWLFLTSCSIKNAVVCITFKWIKQEKCNKANVQPGTQITNITAINVHLVVKAIIDQQGAIIMIECLISVAIQIHLLLLFLLFKQMFLLLFHNRLVWWLLHFPWSISRPLWKTYVAYWGKEGYCMLEWNLLTGNKYWLL